MSNGELGISFPMDRPTPLRPDVCPVEDWLTFLGHRWNALILWHLKSAPLRHHRLMAALPGITPKVLSERLKALEGRQLLAREEAATFPRSVYYQLTEQGQGVVTILDRLELWAKAGQQSVTAGDGDIPGGWIG